MIITKKKLNEMLAEKEKEVADRFARQIEDEEKWTERRFRGIDRELLELKEELRELKGINDKYNVLKDKYNILKAMITRGA